MQGQVLPRLGVDQHALALISAWVSAERFIATKDTEYLTTVQGVLRSSNPNAASRVHDGMSLADQAHTCRIGRQKSTGAAIMNTFSGLASDTFQTLTPEQLAIVLDIIRMTSPEASTVPQLLHEYVGSSADKEMERIWGPVHSGGNAGHLPADDMELCMNRTRVGSLPYNALCSMLYHLNVPSLHCFVPSQTYPLFRFVWSNSHHHAGGREGRLQQQYIQFCLYFCCK